MNTTVKEVVVVDWTVADYQTLIAGISPNTPVIVLQAGHSGLSGLAEALAGYSNLDAIHLVTEGHGGGAIQLGLNWVDDVAIKADAANVQAIGDALKSGGDLLLYGCSVANNDAGQQFVQDLASQLGDVNVAASTDKTGPTQLGGDWDLEYSTGTIDTVLPFTLAGMQDISHCLGCTVSTTVNQTVFYYDGNTTGKAIIGSDGSTIVGAKLPWVTYALGSLDSRTNPSRPDDPLSQIGYWNTMASFDEYHPTECGSANTAPTLVGTTKTLTAIDEDSGVPSGTVGNLVSDLVAIGTNVTDADSGAVTGIAITATDSTNGTWYYSTDSGSTWSTVGAVSNTSALLLGTANRVYFKPNANWNGTVSPGLTFRAWDTTSGTVASKVDTSTNGGSTAFSTATVTASITVNSVNDVPTVTASGGTTAFTEGANTTSTPVTVDSGLTLADVDSATLASATVTISTGLQTTEDTLAFTNNNMGNIAGSYTSGTGVLNLTSAGSSATLAQWQAALRAVTYTNSSDAPNTTNRVVSIVVNDGAANSVAGTKTVSVAAVNDAPVISDLDGDGSGIDANHAANPFVLGSTAVWLDTVYDPGSGTIGGADVTDADSTDFNGGNLTIIYNTSTATTLKNGSFSLDATGSITSGGDASISAGETLNDGTNNFGIVDSTNDGQNGRPLTILFNSSNAVPNGGGGVSNVGYLIEYLSYTAPSIEGNRVFDVTVSDGDGGTSVVSTVTMTGTNTAPTLGNSATYTFSNINEDASASTGVTVSSLLADSNVVYADADSSNITPIQGIAVTGKTGNGTWEYSTDGTIWNSFGTVAGNTALLLSATTQIHYVPAANETGNATITVRAWDTTDGSTASTNSAANTANTTTNGGSTAFSSNTATATLTVDAINDIPTRTAGSLSFTAVNEDSANTTAVSLGLSSVTYGAGGGSDESSQTLTYKITGIPSFITLWKSDETTQVSANDTVTSAELQGLKYKTVANANGTGDLTFTVKDNGGTSNGGVDTLTQMLSMTVNAVNDAPTLTTISTLTGGTEDTAYTISYANLAAAADEADVENSAISFRVEAVSSGTLYTDSGLTTPVTSGTTLLSSGGSWYWKPATNANGLATNAFTVKAYDGTAASTTAIQVKVNVAAVNDAPVITSNGGGASAAISITENQTAVTTVVATDVESDTITYTLSGTDAALFSINSSGVLTFNSAPNYESPADSGTDNVYDVTVTATDNGTGNLTDTQAIALTVVNANEIPTITATGATPSFAQGSATSVDLFSAVTASTVDTGQTFSGAVLTVTNVSDTTEYLTIGGTNVALTNGASGTIASVGNYSVAVNTGTATVTLSGMTQSNANMGTLIDGISYKNDDSSATAGNRVVALTTVTDSGANHKSASVNLAATVTVTTNTAPVITNLNSDTVAWAGVSQAVLLDLGANATVSDVELGSNWDGASLTIQQVTSGGIADGSVNDVYNFASSSLFNVTGGTVTKGANANGTLTTSGSTQFATWAYTSTTGTLAINFDADATPTLVQDVIQHINYANATPYGNAIIRFGLSDGTDTTNSDVTVTSSTIYVDKTTYDANGDAADGFNLAEALAKAADGDTILIKDGTYRGQFVATTAVTIDAELGAGGNVTLEAPDTVDLVKSNQDFLTNNGRWRMPILDLKTDVAGQGTVTVKNLTVNGRYQAVDDGFNANKDLIGISTFNTNAVIDGVTVKHIAQTVDVGTGDYSGMSEHFGIVAEGSSALTNPVTVTIQNSTIGTFQKTGIIAWGSKLNVNILNNHITGVGVHGISNQNGMQIGSANNNNGDGTFADREGTTGTITGNTVDGLDTVSPDYFATAILLRMTGSMDVVGNTISVDRAPALNETAGIDLMEVNSPITVRDNVLNNLRYGVILESPYGTAYNSSHTLSDNTSNSTITPSTTILTTR